MAHGWGRSFVKVTRGENTVLPKVALRPVRRTLQSVSKIALAWCGVSGFLYARTLGHGIAGLSIQHYSRIELTASNIDIEIDLTFEAILAQRERQQMDADHEAGRCREASLRESQKDFRERKGSACCSQVI